MSKPSTKPRLKCTSVDFIEIECPRPTVPRLVIRLTHGITILMESSADFPLACEFIAYQGIIHTDGYTVYDTVAAKHGQRHAGCLAHTRRKFTDLGKAAPSPKSFTALSAKHSSGISPAAMSPKPSTTTSTNGTKSSSALKTEC